MSKKWSGTFFSTEPAPNTGAFVSNSVSLVNCLQQTLKTHEVSFTGGCGVFTADRSLFQLQLVQKY